MSLIDVVLGQAPTVQLAVVGEGRWCDVFLDGKLVIAGTYRGDRAWSFERTSEPSASLVAKEWVYQRLAHEAQTELERRGLNPK